MKNHHRHATPRGPFRADQLHVGDPYELSHGHPIECLPTGGRGSRANRAGAQVLGTDPAVEEVGIDTGYAIEDDTLRAPDIAVGNVPDRPGWVRGVPPLAVEYADTGQDEADLTEKIAELLAAGTLWVWVVRLTGPRRVEVHQQGQPMRLVQPGALLEAPGLLRNAVPVEAMYEERAANDATLRNLLQRHGYDSLEQVWAQGRQQGIEQGIEKGIEKGIEEGIEKGRLASLREAIVQLMDAKGLALDASARRAIGGCVNAKQLMAWLRRAGDASSVEDVFQDE